MFSLGGRRRPLVRLRVSHRKGPDDVSQPKKKKSKMERRRIRRRLESSSDNP